MFEHLLVDPSARKLKRYQPIFPAVILLVELLPHPFVFVREGSNSMLHNRQTAVLKTGDSKNLLATMTLWLMIFLGWWIHQGIELICLALIGPPCVEARSIRCPLECWA